MLSFISAIIDRKIRLAFLGCGRVSAFHFKAIESHRNAVEVVGCCDAEEEKARKACEHMGGIAYTSLSAMLKAQRPDVVVIASPNGMHPPHVMQVADHGIHVATEKPMAIRYEDGVKMVKHCYQRKVDLFVIHQNRYNPTVRRLYEARKAGRFGKVALIACNVYWSRAPSYYLRKKEWHGTKTLDGGAFFTQASHYVDLMTWLSGSSLHKVYAKLATFSRRIETEDCGTVSIEWHNGTLGNINVSILAYPEDVEGSVTVIGEYGTVQIGGVALNKILHWAFAEPEPDDAGAVADNYETASVYGTGHVQFYENLVKKFRGRPADILGGYESLKTLHLLDAIQKANQNGEPAIFSPDEPSS